MSDKAPILEQDGPGPSPARTWSASTQPAKSQRVLACVACQQRKVKCDRRFPCANCVKGHLQCIPATLVRRPRKQRFPERELLQRIRGYEGLLRQHNIKFEPLHKDPAKDVASPNAEGTVGSDNESPEAMDATTPASSTAASKHESVHETKDFWHAMKKGFRDHENDSEVSDEDVRDVTVKRAWDQSFQNNDYLLLGGQSSFVDLSPLHPEPAQIFRFWQIYLDNVDPMFKVTHSPSLQGRIVEAATNLTNIDPNLEALMFSIYCSAALSLGVAQCLTLLGTSKDVLLTRYQFGCQQALSNARFLRTNDRDCLTAFFLYLVSVGPQADPRSLSSIFGVAVRIAQRMGLHRESEYAKCTIFEGEMRRRLWWSLVIFDSRIGELGDCKSFTLSPMWDCRVPLNVSDADLRPEMRTTPVAQGKPSEALFAVVRSEVADYIRHTMFYLDFTNPALKPIAKDLQNGPVSDGSELGTLEKVMEEKYLQFCDPDTPVQFMTYWMARAYLTKCRLVELYSRSSDSSAPQTEAQRDAALDEALTILLSDTKIMTSPLTKGFRWLLYFYFPFHAYMHAFQDLRKRPITERAARAWEVMSDNYEARFCGGEAQCDGPLDGASGPLFNMFAKLVLGAWEVREAALKHNGEPLTPPQIVAKIRQRVAQLAQEAPGISEIQSADIMGMSIDDFNLSMPANVGSHGLLYGLGGQDDFAGIYGGVPGQTSGGLDMNQLNWAAMDWGAGARRGV